jgi:hypothetical protein
VRSLAALAWRKIAACQRAADVAQVEARIRVLNRAFRIFRQRVGDPRGEIAKLDSRHAHQLDQGQQSHILLHHFRPRPSRPSCERPDATEEAAAPLAAGTSEEECPGTCSHEPRNGAKGPGEGRDGVFAGEMEERRADERADARA